MQSAISVRTAVPRVWTAAQVQHSQMVWVTFVYQVQKWGSQIISVRQQMGHASLCQAQVEQKHQPTSFRAYAVLHNRPRPKDKSWTCPVQLSFTSLDSARMCQHFVGFAMRSQMFFVTWGNAHCTRFRRWDIPQTSQFDSILWMADSHLCLLETVVMSCACFLLMILLCIYFACRPGILLESICLMSVCIKWALHLNNQQQNAVIFVCLDNTQSQIERLPYW